MSVETPLDPQIEVVSDGRFTVCNCCAADDGTVMRLILGWRERGKKNPHGGATSVSLCRSCRVETADAIDEANNPYSGEPDGPDGGCSNG